ncbi:Putative collagen-binding domain of a collagenase [Robiginitalea myxolifaciens]|uniref:Putative collagen-binding domain of a collagenase n=1 Tax=Robiginitalea myxolifaciens TaxID=400055 RepID=A0A1I6HFG6_9FLAO|nr:DUF4038 domain-containing protein [Robiginitalea myxolifaciens]SFR53226.1 Putative collagen-binding domain of a collagenase [Robiginitalea myxolifaciens]
MKKQAWIYFVVALIFHQISFAQLKVSDNGRFLSQADGSPFFWMADTAWELTHRCNREEIIMYLDKRKEQGFNVIQTVALAELDGLNTPNKVGDKPLLDLDPAKPNSSYFEIIDFLLSEAESRGIYIALLPTWGDKVFKNSWGVGPEVFTPENARVFGEWIGNRYKDRQNIIWVIGGDRNPRDETDVSVWNAMAEGIVTACGGTDKALMTFHPQPKANGGSSTWFHQESWLDFNMHQTGHCNTEPVYERITHDYALLPIKPVLDGEPLYERHPLCFNALEKGYSTPEEIRRIMYQNVFAGGFGQTYGCHAVWQMYSPEKEPINGPLGPWYESLDLPVANQVKHLKDLMLSRPFYSRIPTPGLLGKTPADLVYAPIATGDREGSYYMVYLPRGEAVVLNREFLNSPDYTTWWYDPRSGVAMPGESMGNTSNWELSPPSSGTGQDWVLILDKKDAKWKAPGKL